ncbi:MAG: type II toxin-antitoxin system RelE family toxin [Candidatus Nanoarchaeia archaeon]
MYSLLFTPTIERQLKKLKNKDKKTFERIAKKILEIQENPEHYKPLRNMLKGCRRAHIDPFIIIFELEQKTIILHYIKHHDKAYI